MNKILSLSLRPQTLSHLYGQDTMVSGIRNQVAKRPPSTWLFTGPSGSGKTTTGRILAVSYQCTHMKLWGDPCDECWSRYDEFSIHEPQTDASGVDDIREIVSMSRFKPSNSNGKRIIILDEAHQLSKQSNNLLLKPTEDVSPSTIWIFLTSEPSKILATLKRRCTTYALKSLSISQAEDFLQTQAKRVGITKPLGDLLEQCHNLQVSAPAQLLQALEKYAAGVSAVEAVSGADGSKVDSFRLCKAITAGDWKTVRGEMKEVTADEVRWLRASISGWLKGSLSRESTPLLAEKAAISILELTAMPFDESVLLNWFWGSVYKICKRYSVR